APFWPSLFEYLEVPLLQLDDIDDLTYRVLRYLESEFLVVDPALTGTAGLMVLLGLVPVRWSVRTPKGQQVYRQIKIHAVLWSLEITKKKPGEKSGTEWDFRLRSVNVIKRALKSFACD